MSLRTLGRLFLVGLSIVLAADGLALISGRGVHWPRLGIAALGAIMAVVFTGRTLRHRVVAFVFALGAIGGIGRAALRVAHARGGIWEAAQLELVTLLICAAYTVVFLRLTARDQQR